MIENPELRRSLGAAARRRIEDKFTWAAVARRYVEEYGQHATNGRSPALDLSHGTISPARVGSVVGFLAAAQAALPGIS